ncbi:MAG: DUF3887 domain-containing protein [Chloroflexaceae bacterium]|nr:DUF3887 domain-containing protein [Chloroflexaceae bacterium]
MNCRLRRNCRYFLVTLSVFSVLAGDWFGDRYQHPQVLAQSIPGAAVGSAANLAPKARAVVESLAAENYPQVLSNLHPELRSQWTPEAMAEIWQELTAETGKVVEIVDTEVIDTINADLAIVAVKFANTTDRIIISFNKQQQIIGIDLPRVETVEQVAANFVAALAANNFARARSYLHPKLKTELFPQQVERKWQELLARTGPLQRQLGITVRTGSDLNRVDLALVTLEFEKITDDVIIIVDRDRKIVGVDFPNF